MDTLAIPSKPPLSPRGQEWNSGGSCVLHATRSPSLDLRLAHIRTPNSPRRPGIHAPGNYHAGCAPQSACVLFCAGKDLGAAAEYIGTRSVADTCTSHQVLSALALGSVSSTLSKQKPSVPGDPGAAPRPYPAPCKPSSSASRRTAIPDRVGYTERTKTQARFCLASADG